MNKSIGILGGGQLGKMLFNAGTPLGMELGFMDKSLDSPVGKIAKNYVDGDITNQEDVLNFGRNYNVLTVEIEKVNVDALRQLEKENIEIYPQPEVLATIQDKALQKEFYKKNNLPTSDFQIYDNLSSLIYDLDAGVQKFPFIQKMRRDGYDGRGVQVIKNDASIDQAFPYNFIVEELIDIEKELAVVTCRSKTGEIAIYDPVEMVFHPEQNILLYQLAPARLSQSQSDEIQNLAKQVSAAFGIVGLLAIEFFLTRSGEILINEVAPRPHNSGHHTIEANHCSQYENHLRAISGLPLGHTGTLHASAMLNVLGEPGHTGSVIYDGLEAILEEEGVHIHLYGKSVTKPYRKMGHVNIIGNDIEALILKADMVQNTLRVISSGD